MRSVNGRTIAGALFIIYAIAWFSWPRNSYGPWAQPSGMRPAVDIDDASLHSIRNATLGVWVYYRRYCFLMVADGFFVASSSKKYSPSVSRKGLISAMRSLWERHIPV